MARTTVVELTDDIDGSPAAQTVRFDLDGRSFEIDLSTTHAQGLRDSLAPFIAAARPAGRVIAAAQRGRQRPGRPRDVDSAAVRAWAVQNGVGVSDRGVIPQAVLAQYSSAEQAPPTEPAPEEPAPDERAPDDPAPDAPVAAAVTPAERVADAPVGDKPKRSRRRAG